MNCLAPSMIRLAHLVARGAVGHQQVGDLLAGVGAGERGDGHQARDIGACVGDELLGAVDDPLACAPLGRLQAGAGLGVARVRPGLGLGETEGTQLAPAAELGHPLALLLFCAEEVDRLGAQRRVGAERDGHGGVDARELLDGQRVGQRVGARAAVLLGKGNAHEVQLAELGNQLVGDGLGAVELSGHRRHLALGELPHRAPDQLVVVGEVEVHPV